MCIRDRRLQGDTTEYGGVAMSLARIEKDSLTYLGVGDTHAYLNRETSFRPLLNIDGRVGGRQLRQLQEKVYLLKPNDIFIMCTDGINTQISLSQIPTTHTAQNMANLIFNQYHRLYGDVTVLLVKYRSSYE